MALHDRQRVYLYIWALNPIMPLPYEDERNFWTVNFTSRGDTSRPEGFSFHDPPCKGNQYNPPFCNNTGESYYVNPMGMPQSMRLYHVLFPTADQTRRIAGPYR